MGWKTFKLRFEIKKFLVSVDSGEICIGSRFCPDLIKVAPDGGMRSVLNIHGKKGFQDYLRKDFPLLADASREEIVEAIAEKDIFARNISVFTYEGGGSVEKFCEEIGWPNVTHDGCLMYDNTFSENRLTIVEKALRSAHYRAEELVEAELKFKRDLDKVRTDRIKTASEIETLTAMMANSMSETQKNA